MLDAKFLAVKREIITVTSPSFVKNLESKYGKATPIFSDFLNGSQYDFNKGLKLLEESIHKLDKYSKKDDKLNRFFNFIKNWYVFLTKNFPSVYNKVKARVKPYFSRVDFTCNPSLKIEFSNNIGAYSVYTYGGDKPVIRIMPRSLNFFSFSDRTVSEVASELALAHEFGHLFDVITEHIGLLARKFENYENTEAEYSSSYFAFLNILNVKRRSRRHFQDFFEGKASISEFGKAAFNEEKAGKNQRMFSKQFTLLRKIKDVINKLCSTEFLDLKKSIASLKKLDSEGFACLFADKYANDYGLFRYTDINLNYLLPRYRRDYVNELKHFGYSPDELINERTIINKSKILDMNVKSKKLIKQLEKSVKLFSESIRT